MSAQPPEPGPPQVHDPLAIHCPRCSSPVPGDQDWCLECGAPARTRLAQTPNWRLPTVAIGAIVLVAGALLAFAFVKLTNDNDAAPAAATSTTPIVDTVPAAPVPPPVTAPLPSATTTAPVGPAIPSTVPGQTTATVPPVVIAPPPAGATITTPRPTTTGGQQTVPAFGQTTTTP